MITLPAEIWLSIAETMFPDDAFHFAMINKNMWQLCSPLITIHRQMVTKFRYFCADPNGDTLWSLLDGILEVPRIIEYVLELELDVNQNYYYDPKGRWHTRSQESLAKPAPLQVEKYIRAANDCGSLQIPAAIGLANTSITTSAGLHDAISDGCTDAIIPIVLSRLCALKELKLVPCNHGFWFFNALQKMTLACIESRHQSVPGGLFQQLRKVRISHWDTENNIPWEWAALFTRIPCLEYFSGHMLGGAVTTPSFFPMDPNVHNWLQPAQTPTSNLKTLVFSTSMVTAEVVNIILSNCKALEYFEYETGGAVISDEEYDPRGILNAVVDHCADSLQSLILENQDCETIQDLISGIYPIPTLCKMEKLKVLRCEYGTFIENPFDADSVATFDPRVLLPSTLECLQLDNFGGQHRDTNVSGFLDKLSECRMNALPNLAQLFLDTTYSSMHENVVARVTAWGIAYEVVERDWASVFSAQ